MTDKQLEVIVGLMAGMQTAIVHMANVLAKSANINHEDLATSFEETAEAIPAEVKNRALLQIALRQVASGMRNSGAGPEWDALMSRLLH